MVLRRLLAAAALCVVGAASVVHVHTAEDGAQIAEEILESTMNDMRASEHGRALLEDHPSLWQLARNHRFLKANHGERDDEREPEPLEVLHTPRGRLMRSYGPEEGKRKGDAIMAKRAAALGQRHHT